MSSIFDKGTVLPVKEKPLKYSKVFGIGRKNPSNKQVIRIYEGNDEIAKNNILLGKFTLELDKDQKEKKITISMELDHNSILKVIGKINDEKNNEITIEMKFDE